MVLWMFVCHGFKQTDANPALSTCNNLVWDCERWMKVGSKIRQNVLQNHWELLS